MEYVHNVDPNIMYHCSIILKINLINTTDGKKICNKFQRWVQILSLNLNNTHFNTEINTDQKTFHVSVLFSTATVNSVNF